MEAARLAGSRDHWIKKHDEAYAVAMHNDARLAILDMREPHEMSAFKPSDGMVALLSEIYERPLNELRDLPVTNGPALQGRHRLEPG